MNENEFEYKGKIYISIDDPGNCFDCAFYNKNDRRPCSLIPGCIDVPPCFKSQRKDKREVIFKEQK